jgi:hypothetical protein
VTETGPECCATVLPFISFMSFNILEHFSGLVSVCQHSLFCVQSSIFWLDRVGYKNYLLTQPGPVSTEAPPVSEQQLWFCWCQL